MFAVQIIFKGVPFLATTSVGGILVQETEEPLIEDVGKSPSSPEFKAEVVTIPDLIDQVLVLLADQETVFRLPTSAGVFYGVKLHLPVPTSSSPD